MCTHAVPICGNCVRVHGPTAAAHVTLRPLPHLHGRGYAGEAAWEEQYRGSVRIDLQPATCDPVRAAALLPQLGAAARLGLR